jgi:energy-coupling factor transporter ATP-binding protein EcfA2
VSFLRPESLEPLPEPVGTGISLRAGLAELLPHVPLEPLVTFIASCYLQSGTYPVLLLVGPPGSGKSTTLRFIKRLVDPSESMAGALPRYDRPEDGALNASNNHLLVYDNISSIPRSASDFLCRTTSGHSWSSRRKYRDKEEVHFRWHRPVAMAGIVAPSMPADLSQRSLLVPVEEIPPGRIRGEVWLDTRFAGLLPQLLGSLFDALATGLTRLQGLADADVPWPRLVDAAQLVEACGPVLGLAPGVGSSLIGTGNAELVMSGEPLVHAVVMLLRSRGGAFQGSVTQLLAALRAAGYAQADTSAAALGQRLQRFKGLLLEVDVIFEKHREGHGGDRRISLISFSRAEVAFPEASGDPASDGWQTEDRGLEEGAF